MYLTVFFGIAPYFLRYFFQFVPKSGQQRVDIFLNPCVFYLLVFKAKITPSIEFLGLGGGLATTLAFWGADPICGGDPQKEPVGMYTS